MQLSPTEILIVAVIALIVLGPERLPKAARQVGKALGELKRMSSGVQAQVNEAMRQDDDKPANRAPSEPERPANPNTEGFRLIDSKIDPLPEDQPSANPGPMSSPSEHSSGAGKSSSGHAKQSGAEEPLSDEPK